MPLRRRARTDQMDRPQNVGRQAVQAAPVGCRHVVSCPILDTAGLALRPPCGGLPYALTGFGSARRSASFLGCVTSTTNHQ